MKQREYFGKKMFLACTHFLITIEFLGDIFSVVSTFAGQNTSRTLLKRLQLEWQSEAAIFLAAKHNQP